MRPALPNEVSSAGPRRSTRTVERPRFCRCSATQTPTIPAPSTSASTVFSGISATLLLDGERVLEVRDQIADVLDAGGEPDERIGASHAGAPLRPHLEVNRMRD